MDKQQLQEAAGGQITTAMSPDQVAQTWSTLLALEKRMREVKNSMRDQMIEWIDANGELLIGDVRYYVGTVTKNRCNDITRTLEQVMNSAGGSMEDVAGTLSSNAFKHGATRNLVGDAKFHELFTVEQVPDLKTGKPRRELKSADTRFLK